jgi:hypothetical protein
MARTSTVKRPNGKNAGEKAVSRSGLRRPPGNVAFWQTVLQKSFWGADQNFSGLLMRFARGDTRDHIVSHKNDHGASYERYGVLQCGAG